MSKPLATSQHYPIEGLNRSLLCRKNFLLIFPTLLFDDKMKIARKPGKKQKENPVGCTVEVKRKYKGRVKRR